MISLKNVSKSYGETSVVRNLSLDAEPGQILVLLGASGCGKTTTLKMINRLIEPSAGTISVGGVDTSTMDPIALRRSIGYVFQDIGLFPHMSVRQNIALPCTLGRPSSQEKWTTKKTDARVLELLETVGLDSGFASRPPSRLSGGQQQRVGIARALATDPEYLLMDEPFGALDAVTRDQLQEELLALNAKLHKTIVFVTHDLFEAIRLGDRVAVMHGGQIEQVGAPRDLLDRPASDRVEQLFSHAKRQVELLKGAG